MSSENKIDEFEVGSKLDRYELLSRIGAGGMGLIFKGFDTKLKRTVAIKVISDRVQDPEVRGTIRERFINEARAAGGLSHPNLVQIYDFGETETSAYIVMEYLEGETLESLLRTKQQLNLEELLRVTKEVSAGLAFAHKKGIVHRDVKPSNIILESHSGICKILDFGIAKFVDQEEMKLTSTGMVLGSTHYLSPEHIIGKGMDGRSDIFSLGTCLYEAASGSLPFRGANSSSILYKIIHFDPQPLSEIRTDLPEDYIALIEKCLKKNPADRYQSGDEVEKAVFEMQSNLLNRRQHATSKNTAPIRLRSYNVRESQLLTLLKTQNKISPEQAEQLRGKPIVDTLLKESWMTEDDVAKVIADCLELPWINRGRIKNMKVQDSAFALVSRDLISRYNLVPFYKDDEKKTLSLLIDGVADFQRDPIYADLSDRFQLQFYVSSTQAIKRLIDQTARIKDSGKVSGPQRLMDGDTGLTGEHQFEKRVLFIDDESQHHEALISLFKRAENALVLASDLVEAQAKLDSSAFDFVWANRSLIGDELEFELQVLKNNPNSELRLFDHFAVELFQESITYRQVRDLFKKVSQRYLFSVNRAQQKTIADFAKLATAVVQRLSENQRIRDETFFTALIYKLDQQLATPSGLIDIFDSVLHIRHAFDCLQERYDGRGPKGLRGEQIPLASRILVILTFMESVKPDWAQVWTAEELKTLEQKFDQYATKQLDPVVTSALIEVITRSRAEVREGTSRIMIIDPDKEYSSRLAAQLSKFGELTIFHDGLSALEAIKKQKPDLIVSEVIVSKLDGFSLCARLRADEALKKIPMVFVSQSTLPEHSTRALQIGAEDFISKSSEARFIVAKLEKVLNKKLA